MVLAIAAAVVATAVLLALALAPTTPYNHIRQHLPGILLRASPLRHSVLAFLLHPPDKPLFRFWIFIFMD